MEFTLKKLEEIIESNKDTLLKALLEDYYEEYELKSQDGSEIILKYRWPEDMQEDITIDITDIEIVLNLGYDGLINLVKKLDIFKPLPDVNSPEETCNRMIEFAKDVISPIIDVEDYEVRLTDGDGIDDSYYIVCFLDKDDYEKEKKYINEDLIKFKVAAEDTVIFELSKWPKAHLNLTGNYFYRRGINSEELVRGIFLSYYYFGNVKYED